MNNNLVRNYTPLQHHKKKKKTCHEFVNKVAAHFKQTEWVEEDSEDPDALLDPLNIVTYPCTPVSSWIHWTVKW
jgi:hypothetical protein